MIVGFIGIGAMGWPMAANVFRAGHDLVVYDNAPGRAEHFTAEVGGRAAGSLAELSAAEFIVTMLPQGVAVRDVYATGGLAALLSPGTVLIDMGSGDAGDTRALGADLATKGLVLLDAPVTGAVAQAASATLAVLIGGDDTAAIARAKPLLSTMGNTLSDMGGLGSGHARDALNNNEAQRASDNNRSGD